MAESAGLPIAHVGSEVAGKNVVTGSPTVFVGSTAIGQADRCPTCSPAVGQPVNPILGAKLLPAETDFALPAPAPFAFSRSYLSRDARIGSLGQGWSLPGEGLGLELGADATTLIDSQGRRIAFPALAPGAAFYSGSELLWLRRGGVADGESFVPWTGRWAAVAEATQRHEGAVLVLAGQSFLEFRRGADGAWRLYAAFDRNGYRTTFAWGEPGVLASIRDSAGRSYALVYRRLLTATQDDNGLRLSGVILANPTGPIPADFDPRRPGLDWLVRYDFDAAGNLVAVRNREGEVVRTFAWRNHLLVGHGQPSGLEVRYEWDRLEPTGKVLRQEETDGLSRTFAYHPGHTEVTDSLGRIERYEFTGEAGAQRWSAHVRADGSRIAYEHDLFGRLVAVTDPLGRVSRRHLDGKGRLYETVSPGRASQRYRLDPETGNTLGMTDAQGREWRFVRDARGNLLEAHGPGGAVTRYHYDDPQLPDRPTRIEDAKGGSRRLTWNRLGQLTGHTDCSGHTRSATYDADGQLVRQRDALGQVTAFAYDRLGRLVEVRLADGSVLRHRYDALDRRIAVEGPEGRVTHLGWDRFGRPTRLQDAAGREQAYHYDAAGRLVHLVNENGASTRFAYDALDRLVEETGFDGRTQRYRYNAAGELVEREEADGHVTRYAYDADGRLLVRRLPATAEVPAFEEHYRWSRDGRLEAVLAPDSEVLLGYDEAGRLAMETQAQGDWTYSVVHEHDVLGVRQRTGYGDAPAVNWLTYGPGHLHGVVVESLELAFERDALHREIHRDARRQGDTEPVFGQARTYDSLGRLSESRLQPVVGEAWSRRYGYDVHGQLTRIDDPHGPITYGYDASGRLTLSHHGEQPTRYRFDPAGNRLGNAVRPPRPEADWSQLVQANLDNPDFDLLGKGQALTQGPQERWPGNRVNELDGRVYRYDAAGNLLERRDPDGSVLTLAYDGAHRLTRLRRREADGTEVEAAYRYDGLSRRILKQVLRGDTLSTTRFGWDGDRQCAEVGEDWQRTTVHEPGGFVPLLRLEQARAPDPLELIQARRLLASQGQALPEAYRPPVDRLRLACFHTDHLGTPLRLTGEDGQLRWQAEPDDWAAVRAERGDTDQPIRFQGQYHDEESGLYYNRYRYYAPELGRYVSQDPTGLLGGMNGYAYPLNPQLFIDPMGLKTTVIVNNNGIGHVGVLVGTGNEKVLFDPGGSYRVDIKGSGDALEGSDANLEDYIRYQKEDGKDVRVYEFDTTTEEETKIKNRIDIGGCAPLFCATCSGEVLRGIGPFKGMGSTRTPWGMADELEKIKNPKPSLFQKIKDFIK